MKNRKKIIGGILTYFKKIMLHLYVLLANSLVFCGGFMLFLLFVEEEYVINDFMEVLTHRESTICAVGFCALFIFMFGCSILKKYEYNFIKKELKNKFNIKIQGGAIVSEEN